MKQKKNDPDSRMELKKNYWTYCKDCSPFWIYCKNCEHQFWGKTKIRYPECPNCEAKCLIVNPSEKSIKERERMWRFLNDDDMETSAELNHDEFMEESFQDMEYEGHWSDTPHAYAHEMAEKVREDLR